MSTLENTSVPLTETDTPQDAVTPTILVVDDDQDILDILKQVLSPSFEVHTLREPTKVEPAVHTLKPDILMLDICMPQLDGMTLCRKLREDSVNDIMPIVFLSALKASDQRLSAFEAGADDFISKPFQFEELKAKVGVWTRMAMRSREMLQCNRQLEELVQTDALTGLLSRRHVLDLLDEEMARYSRYKTPFSVLMIDIDDFKHLNDDYGHATGDTALKVVGKALQKAVRANDRVARYGGDEFLIILANSDLTAAEQACQKLQTLEISCETRDGRREPLSMSIGAASPGPATPHATELIDAADVAMLVAKSGGKGRYHVNRTDSDGDLDTLQELRATRSSMREVLCSILGRTLAQLDRQGEVLGNRTDLMIGLADCVAENRKLSQHDRQTLRNAILIAPYEKLNLSWEIMSRPGGLSPEHREVLRETARRNLNTLRETGFLIEEADILEHIHEWHDGSGFPDGLQGEAIPLLSRILGLLSAYCLLREGGPHTPAHGHAEALRAICQETGSHFDPQLVEELKVVLNAYFRDSHDKATGDLLLVEDYEPVRRIIARRLTAGGYEVVEAGNLKTARELITKRNWHAVLTDLMLPDGSGLDLMTWIREQPETTAIPLAVVSSRFDKKSIESAREANAFAYVVKPIRFEPLLKALASIQEGSVPEFQIIDR